VYREVWRGKVWTARPVVVVQDTPDLIVLFLRLGTRWRIPAGNRAKFFNYQQTGRWDLTETIWTWGDTLYLLQPDAAHAVHVMWGAENREFVGWYINLQEPLRRTAIGFDFMDQHLDIWVAPDLTTWNWKDEDHLQQAQAGGLCSTKDVEAIRDEGEKVVTQIEAKDSPFCDGWETWLPPTEWSIPNLPEGWDRI
jgi:hypothetical protein